MSFHIVHKGDFNITQKYLNKLLKKNYLNIIAEYGKKGVEALQAFTPISSGLTRHSWNFEILEYKDQIVLAFNNTNLVGNYNIAILLQYGHATRNGGYSVGYDYINPSLKPIFDNLAEKLWKEVTTD